jgi:hypothetical protein
MIRTVMEGPKKGQSSDCILSSSWYGFFGVALVEDLSDTENEGEN